MTRFNRAGLLLFLILGMLWAVPLAAEEFGSGWTLNWYPNTALSGSPVATTNADRIDFDFRAGTPVIPSGIDLNSFSLRAQASVNFAAGTYRFSSGSDDGLRLYVDGVILTTAFIDRGYVQGQDQAEVYLTAGAHNVQVEYYQNNGDARLRVSWEQISATNQTQTSATANPAATAAPTAIPLPEGQVGTGQVVGAEGLTVRSGPFLGASRVTIIAPGTEYPLFARNTAEGEFTWYRIQVQSSVAVVDDITGETISTPSGPIRNGWVSGRYFVIDVADAQIPVETTIFETLTAPARTGVVGVLRSNMRLRAGASYRTSTLAILDWGAEVEIVGRTIQARENHWFQVYYGDQVGWLFAPFITIQGDINTVPTY
ncbi:MAG: PA14 domain-containing protein [Phototrophicaceae bacterium]